MASIAALQGGTRKKRREGVRRASEMPTYLKEHELAKTDQGSHLEKIGEAD